jgi:hypothetical protein
MLSEISNRQKKFFCNRFNLTLNFNPKGGLTGHFYPFPNLSKIATEVKGLYSNVNKHEVIHVNCVFCNPNLLNTAQICFAGEIFEYDGQHECLMIKWLMIQEVLDIALIDGDLVIMLDAKYDDDGKEIEKINKYIEKHAFQPIVLS